MSSEIWNFAVCTIFAREFMEGAIIIGEYRTTIQRADIKEEDGLPTKEVLLKAVNVWAAIASALAILVVVIVAIPLAVLSNDFDEKTADIIEGVSKIVAAFCILQLSLKIPKWFGFYKNKKNGKVAEDFDMTLPSIRFNVGWNVWREVAECGVFLLPFFLQGDGLKSIPLSAVVGIAVGLGVGFFVYWANRQFENKFYLAVFITLLLIFLATGLFVGGCHEFEEVYGETRKVWRVQNDFWYHKKLPMAILKPFGYSGSRTVLQIACFWSWLGLSAALHGFMMYRTKKINEELAQLAEQAPEKEADMEEGEKGSPGTSEAEEATA